MSNRMNAIVLAAAGLAGLAAPAGAQTPDSAAAGTTRYTLVEVGGKPLPVEVDKEWRCRESVHAGTLMLRDDGRWLLETSKREVCGDRTEEDRDDEDGTWKAEGNTLRFYDDDGRENTDDWDLDRDIDLDDLTTGTLRDDGTLTVQLADDETTLLFRRE